VSSDLLLDEDVKRVSSCELEVDIVAADILNRLQVDGENQTCVYSSVIKAIHYAVWDVDISGLPTSTRVSSRGHSHRLATGVSL